MSASGTPSTCHLTPPSILVDVMFAMDSPEIITVLDWELATIGHPLADLAHVLSNYLHPTFVPTPGTPTFEEAQKMYCEAVGRPYPIPGFAFCCAFSAFRMGVIAQVSERWGTR